MVCDEVDDEDCVGVDAGCSGGDGGGEVDCGEEEAGMEGSLSHLYVDVKSCLLGWVENAPNGRYKKSTSEYMLG